HRQQMGCPIDDDLVWHTQIDDPSDDKDFGTSTDDFLGALTKGDHEAGFSAHRHYHPMERVIATTRDVKEIEQGSCREDFELLLGLCLRDARLAHEFIEGQANPDGEVLAHFSTNLLADFDRELATFAYRATVAVGPLVIGRAEKLADAITVRTMNLYAIEPGNLHIQGGHTKASHQIVDLHLLHHHGSLSVNYRWDL